jgi:hypothetical protein
VWLSSQDAGFLHVGHPDWSLPPDAIDEVWLDFVGGCGWGVIMRDKMIRRRPRERAMLEKHRMTAVVIATRRNMDFAQQQNLVREYWDVLDDTLRGGRAGLFHLTTSGIRLMEAF